MASLKGSVVDTQLTTPEIFNDIYYITEKERPEGKLADTLIETFEEVKEYDTSLVEIFKDLLIKNAKKNGYGGNWNDITIWKKFNDILYWWDVLNEKGEKEIITQKDANYAKKLVDIIKNQMPGKKVINSNCQFQVPIYGTTLINGEEIAIKGLLDILDVADNKVIITDLKTTGYSDLEKLIEDRNYLIQASMYYDLVAQKYPHRKIIFNHLFCQGYKVSLREVIPIDLDRGRDGRTVFSDVSEINGIKVISKKYYPGYKSLIELYLSCQKAKLNHFDFNHHYNFGVLPYKSIYE